MSEAKTAKSKRKAPPRDDEVPRPFIKCAGGKRRLLPELMKRVPERFGRYYEGFVGGGALFWHLQREGRLQGGASLIDKNDRIIRAYRGIRDQIAAVILLLSDHAKEHALHGRQYFLDTRRIDIESHSDAEVAAWLIYVNRAGYNGLYRVNKKGEVNTPYGDGSPIVIDEENLRACSRALQRSVELVCADFAASETPLANKLAEHHASSGDFIYFDSPYVPTSKSANFVSYTADGFTLEDQECLAVQARTLKEAGTHVILTNSDSPFVRELYPQPFWKVDRVEVRGDALNSDPKKRGRIGELIIW